jgi:AAA+ superfamily predicted ATPase
LVEEQHRADLLRSHGIEPRNRILLVGEPGNGKTSLAEALAGELAVPLLVVRYEAIVGSYLGETAVRLARLFDRVRARRCVLFFDEFDAIGKERGDKHETGEIKRVVSSLLLNVDALPSYVVTVAATNHPELLDRAIWRRFQLRLELPKPTAREIKEWLARFEAALGTNLGLQAKVVADRLKGLSYAELDELCTDMQRRIVLAGPAPDLKKVVSSRLAQWRLRGAVHG